MKHTFEQKVFYADTDAYGVVWHGAYLRWLEMGRVYLCEQMGLDLVELKNQDVLIPVTNMNVRYKMSAKINDNLIVETEISKCNSLTAVFKQTIRHKESGRICIEAEFEIVAVNNDGKLYRQMPEVLTKAFEECLKCPALV